MRILALLACTLALAACDQASAPDDAASPEPTGTVAATNAEVQPVPTATATGGAPPSARDTAMAETSTPIPADAAPSACGADKAAKFVGKIATPEIRAQTIEAVGHNRIRWIGPDTVVTMDFSESRLNAELNASNRITGFRCG